MSGESSEGNFVVPRDEPSEIYMLLNSELVEINLSRISICIIRFLTRMLLFMLYQINFDLIVCTSLIMDMQLYGGGVAYMIMGVYNVIVKFDSDFCAHIKRSQVHSTYGYLIYVGKLECTCFAGVFSKGAIKMFKGALKTLKGCQEEYHIQHAY